jgi:spore coat polysaccharide biosynthesis protein SpsF (cytidylyltransferase family)
MDPDLVDRALSELAKGDADYVCNVDPPTFPNGLDVECFSMTALENAWRLAKLPSEREHVTPFLRKGGAGTRVSNWRAIADLSHFRWTVDYQEDVDHVRALVDAFVKDTGRTDPGSFDRFDLLRCVERHGLGHGTLHDRNEGYLKSLAMEAKGAVTN